MSRAVIIHRHADEDMIAAAEWIAHDSPEQATAFMIAAARTIQLLAEDAGVGALYATLDPTLAGLRRFPVSGFPNYLILYRYDEAQVVVYRVVHGARDIRGMFADDPAGP